ncbi:MAG TPA: hypothetical protein VJ985_04230 [Gammaproteobacteria bacterium]|nr:hypothetical protein [Gammaproteobacteria bacterium]
MKQTLLDLMSAMMPYMMPLVWAGGAAVGASLLLLILKQARFARWGAGLALALGVFFLACQGMGALLGAQPSINFGDPSQFEFILVPFWQIGLGLAVPGTVAGLLARARQTGAAEPA